MKLPAEEYEAAQTLFEYLTVEYPPKPADVLIGLGTYHLGAAHRAAELWQQGFAPYIIFSGYKNDRHPSTEAEMLRDEAVKYGVPEHVIFIENKASNTGLNVMLSYQLAREHGLLISNRVIFIHKPYMTRRTYATAKAQWPDHATEIFVTSPRITLEKFFKADGTEQTIRSMLSDFHCIKIYPTKGWQITQDIPAEVEAASNLLIMRGHALHIPT